MRFSSYLNYPCWVKLWVFLFLGLLNNLEGTSLLYIISLVSPSEIRTFSYTILESVEHKRNPYVQYSKHSTGLIVLSCFYPLFLFYFGVEKNHSKSRPFFFLFSFMIRPLRYDTFQYVYFYFMHTPPIMVKLQMHFVRVNRCAFRDVVTRILVKKI